MQAIIDATENGLIKTAKVALVVSSRSDAYGLERAKKHGIPSLVIRGSESRKLLAKLKAHKINGIVLAGYLSILQPCVINEYKNKIINIHPALLPMFGGKGMYGINVHQAVIASGTPYTGATAHFVDCGVDTGAALIRGVVRVLPGDTAEILQKRVLDVEHIILVRAVRALSGGFAEDYKNNPPVLLSDNDRDGIIDYAREIKNLSEALLNADSEGL